MRIAVGSDERTSLTDTVIEELRRRGHQVELYGALTGTPEQYPEAAQAVAEKVASGECDEGVLFCWTGTGVSIVANKVPGIRAALCHDGETARGARVWNHANVLVMSLRATSEAIAKEMLEAWFNTPFGGGEDERNVAKIRVLEEKYCGPNRPSNIPVSQR